MTKNTRLIGLPENILLCTFVFECESGKHLATVALERNPNSPTGISYHSIVDVDGEWDSLSSKDRSFYVNHVNFCWHKLGCPIS